MSGNGGQPSSLKAAFTGRLPPDRGRKELQNAMDDTMEEELLEEMAQDSNNLESQDRTESWDEEDLYFETEEEIEQGGFSAAMNSVFLVGIANAKSGEQRTPRGENIGINLVTPQDYRQIGSSTLPGRGGRGGIGRRSTPNTQIQAESSLNEEATNQDASVK